MSEIEHEREGWRKMAKEVAENAIAPQASEIDANGEFPRDIVQVLAQKGLLNLLIPKEYGVWD